MPKCQCIGFHVLYILGFLLCIWSIRVYKRLTVVFSFWNRKIHQYYSMYQEYIRTVLMYSCMYTNSKQSCVMTFIFTHVCAFIPTMNMLQKVMRLSTFFATPYPPLMRRYHISGKCRYFWTAPNILSRHIAFLE